MSFTDRRRDGVEEWREVHYMMGNWCRVFEPFQPVLKTSPELILSSATNRLLREVMSLPFASELGSICVFLSVCSIPPNGSFPSSLMPA